MSLGPKLLFVHYRLDLLWLSSLQLLFTRISCSISYFVLYLLQHTDVNSPLNDADPYNGQVQLVDDGNEDLKKTLKLFTSKDKNPGEWGYVCAKEEVMDEVILNTICRQLGFTGYEDYKAQPYR